MVVTIGPWEPNLQSDPIFGASLTYSGGQTRDPKSSKQISRKNTSTNDVVYGFQLET